MKVSTTNCIRDERGGETVGYAFLLACMALIAFTIIGLLGQQVSTSYGRLGAAVYSNGMAGTSSEWGLPTNRRPKGGPGAKPKRKKTGVQPEDVTPLAKPKVSKPPPQSN